MDGDQITLKVQEETKETTITSDTATAPSLDVPSRVAAEGDMGGSSDEPEPSEDEQDAVAVLLQDTAEEAEGGGPPALESLKPGMRMTGVVRNVVDFGAFIDIGVKQDGLAHISTLKRAGVDKGLQIGDKIDVQIRRIDNERGRISLTIPGAGRGAKSSLRELTTNTVVTGRVVRLVDFGAFVDVGAQTDGLIHISQLPGGFVRHPSDVVKVGDEVQVRVLEVDAQRRRISLTMKDLPHEDAEATTQATAEQESSGRFPTAFEAAWERAQIAARRRQKSRRR